MIAIAALIVLLTAALIGLVLALFTGRHEASSALDHACQVAESIPDDVVDRFEGGDLLEDPEYWKLTALQPLVKAAAIEEDDESLHAIADDLAKGAYQLQYDRLEQGYTQIRSRCAAARD
ncbi:hypothetical protein [Blastococcus sp. Marseille-P5729]|uniref:hypothetical protein n=1 Tax=Blastococcus sp. Marseille-P5729 TaxID=2086582 RepID=UPI000D0F85C7|nr:hypothetical protein [Blastococcus sp. Marseille-P5729]